MRASIARPSTYFRDNKSLEAPRLSPSRLLPLRKSIKSAKERMKIKGLRISRLSLRVQFVIGSPFLYPGANDLGKYFHHTIDKRNALIVITNYGLKLGSVFD